MLKLVERAEMMKSWPEILILVVTVAACTNAWAGDIRDAAMTGNLAKLKELLANNPELVKQDDAGAGTPLHVAVAFGRKEAIEFLLANKADINAKDVTFGFTPLHHARSKEIVELLLAHKADVNARAPSGSTPLHWATSSGNMEVVETLLANKADVNGIMKSGATPLDLASYNPKLHAIAQLLLKHGGKKGPGGIHYAVTSGNVAEVKQLLSDYPEVVNQKQPGTKEGNTPLQEAAIFHQKEVIELLLAHKADANAKDNLGRAALHCAIWSSNAEAVKILLANKADVNALDNEGRTPLDMAGGDIAKLLRVHGAKTGKELKAVGAGQTK